MVIAEDNEKLLNVDAKPWSPSGSSQGKEEVVEEGIMNDPFAENENFSWGLQALTGMATSMFPDEEEVDNKSPNSASPALSVSPKEVEGRVQPVVMCSTATQRGPPGTWSPTISHALVGSCPKTAKTVKEAMGLAAEKLRTELTFSSRLSKISTRQQEEETSPEAKQYDYNEELLLRLHNSPDASGSKRAKVPSELLINKPQEPELSKKYPTLMGEQAASSPKWSSHHHNSNNHYHQKKEKEPCRYFAQGGKCRKADCPFYHDPHMFREMQMAYEMEAMKLSQIEREYNMTLNEIINTEMHEKQRDAGENIKAGDRTVYIVGIDSSTSDENILIRLSHYGSIRKYQLCGDPNQPTRYGFFEYSTVSAARNCQTIDCKKMFTRPIRVSKAKDAIKGGRNIPELHQMELLRAAALCLVQNIEAPCVKGSGRPATLLDEPTPPPGKAVVEKPGKKPANAASNSNTDTCNINTAKVNGSSANGVTKPQSPQQDEQNVEVAASPPLSPQGASDKIIWAKKEVPVEVANVES
eukprot:TRINITY_DN824_c1_g1_i5.p1 TRINITY_DN824_c1_g1~~TRINITY_DN824_c1_g1_i5.p1  ORF type:complete len:526 (+),score=101.13 TRINITY_DN824_c1_g1_i5:280-1857(+)